MEILQIFCYFVGAVIFTDVGFYAVSELLRIFNWG